MLKHCQATAIDQTRRSRRNLVLNNNCSMDADALDTSIISCASLNMSANTSFLNVGRDSRRSSYSSTLPMDQPLSMASRTSSFASLSNLSANNDVKRTPIKIFAKCLRSDIEYKTLSVSRHTTSTEVIWMLLSKFKMKHRDPKLFYLTMDIGIISHGSTGAGDSFTRTLVLEDDAFPAELKSCHPWGECRFTLQMRKGGLVRIHDSVLMAESKYKCLLISDNTTVNEVISILFHCYGLERIERVDRYELCEVDSSSYERKLQPDDCPVRVQALWKNQYKFILKRSAVPAFKVSPKPSLSVSTHSSDSMSMDTSNYSSVDSPVPRSPQSSSSGSSVSPTGSVMSASSDESSTSSLSGYPAVMQRPLRYSHAPMLPPNLHPHSHPKTNFNLNGPVTAFPPSSCRKPYTLARFQQQNAIHECGLPATASPKADESKFSSLHSIGPRTRVAFHDYENYFYI